MKQILYYSILVTLAIFTVLGCSQTNAITELTPTPTQTIEPTKTPAADLVDECDPSTDQIEINTSQTKGYGAGYTPPDFLCSAYCLQVPEGKQLTIGFTDSDADLYLHVTRDIYTNWDLGFPANDGIKVKYTNPNGRYYIYVCPNEDSGKFWSHHKSGNRIVFTSAALFSLYNEFIE